MSESQVAAGVPNDDHPDNESTTPPPTSRFVGDLNPEASMIVEAQSGPEPRRDKHRLGIWLEQEQADQSRDGHVRQSPGIHAKNRIGLQTRTARTRSTEPAASPDAEAAVLPSLSDQRALFNIYFLRIHPMLPILDEEQCRKALEKGEFSTMIAQAICILASKDPQAIPHLRLQDSSPSLLSQSRFCSTLYRDITLGLNRRRERNRYHLIQALALLSLHTDSGPEGVEDASMHLAQAVHHALTIGLHLGRSSGRRRMYDKLFWCLWCLSLFNAASNGRPRLMSDLDIGLRIEDIYEHCHPAFRVLLTLSQLLARVIRLYQPTSDPEVNGIDHEFPSFEIVVDQNHGWDIEESILTSLELYYHAVSILSYRTRSTDDVELAEPTASSLRQALSAQQVMRLLNQVPLQNLLPLPTVSYGISMALSQTYRQFRRSRTNTKRAIAQEQLECYVHALENLRDLQHSASTMAIIGRRVLTQVQRLKNTAARRMVEVEDTSGTVQDSGQNTSELAGVSEDRNRESATTLGGEVNSTLAYSHMEPMHGYEHLFADDGTLQAMDNFMDTFMGLDLPNEFMNTSLSADAFDLGFIDSQ